MSRLSNEHILGNIYYDLERGYGSAKSLYEQAEEEGAVITLEEVKNFMKKQPNKQIKGYQNYNRNWFHLLGQNFKQTLWI